MGGVRTVPYFDYFLFGYDNYCNSKTRGSIICHWHRHYFETLHFHVCTVMNLLCISEMGNRDQAKYWHEYKNKAPEISQIQTHILPHS